MSDVPAVAPADWLLEMTLKLGVGAFNNESTPRKRYRFYIPTMLACSAKVASKDARVDGDALAIRPSDKPLLIRPPTRVR